MADPTPLHRPPSLRAALEAGVDLTDFPSLEFLAEAAILDRRTLSPDLLRERAASSRWAVEEHLAGRQPVPFIDGRQATQLALTAQAWRTELYEDGALADRFVRCLPLPHPALPG